MSDVATVAPAWAKGQSLELLRRTAKLFKEDFGPYTHGAFGLPKERDIADALVENQALWTHGAKGDAIALFRVLKHPSTHEDFAGRRLRLPPGSIFVRALAGDEGGKRHLIEHLQSRGVVLWIEAHVEGPTDALLRELEFERVMTKVSASSDLKGLYLAPTTRASGESVVALELPTALHPADIPGAKVLQLDFLTPSECDEILAEIRRWLDGDAGRYAAEQWAQHYSSYNKRQSWTAFALRGFDYGDPGFIIKPSEMSRQWKDANAARLAAPCQPTRAAPFFPGVWAALERVPAIFERVRFMRLTAAGELTRHADITDPDAGTAPQKLARLHIPLLTDERCLFRSWGLDGAENRLHMPRGALCYLDTRKPHAVVNPADAERIHLVADAWTSRELVEMIGA